MSEGRGLQLYRSELSDRFIDLLRGLKSDETWIDFGSGKAIAAEDYLLNRVPEFFDGRDILEKSNVVAITYRYRRWFPAYRGHKLTVQAGRLLEEFSELPRYQLGTDVLGVFSYTQHLDYYFKLTLRHLAVGGHLLISGDFFKTMIVGRDGVPQDVKAWLEKIPGLQVDVTRSHAILITKLQENLQIPRLRIKTIDRGAPPGRSFEEY